MNQNGPTSNECQKIREHEVFLNRLENHMCRADNLLDALVIKVAPVAVDRPCGLANMEGKCTEIRSPFITELYKQSTRLEQIINRLEYIMESVEI
jgi:hypothetical protein